MPHHTQSRGICGQRLPPITFLNQDNSPFVILSTTLKEECRSILYALPTSPREIRIAIGCQELHLRGAKRTANGKYGSCFQPMNALMTTPLPTNQPLTALRFFWELKHVRLSSLSLDIFSFTQVLYLNDVLQDTSVVRRLEVLNKARDS